MSSYDLKSDKGVRSAIVAIGNYQTWGESGRRWIVDLAETIRWVRSADQDTRRTFEFQRRLWEDNNVAAVGQGNVPVERALQDAPFRDWLAAKSMDALPATPEEQVQFLTDLYQDLKRHLEPFLDKKIPHLKIFRVLAALYPEAMTTVASTGALIKLARALGAERGLQPVEQHIWVRERLRAVLGDPGNDVTAIAERMAVPWVLYERYVQPPPDQRTEEESQPGRETRLLPLPAARRRRGMTAIKGLFPAVLSTLEFVRKGVTREELLDFLRSSSPDVKTSSLGVTINSYQGELDVIRLEGDRYVLTERGENVLESQDPSYLADWLLTRILGVDRAIVELRDKGSLAAPVLLAGIRATNPSWASDFMPQSIVAWLRSMGVVRTTPQYKYELTDTGREWGARIHWQPESLPAEPDNGTTPPVVSAPSNTGADLLIPELADIINMIQRAGQFPADLIATLHAGLWSHPRRHFAILTGLSGSGKTLLAREYARALARDGVKGRLFTLPVQPGWYDPGALLGFPNPLRGESYVRTGFLEFLIAAAANPQRPYVAVLDEMNLSHPEQYMAPLLSAMETGEALRLHTEGDFFDGVPGALDYPSNLVLIGTINMDETTHGLSDKVLDRAFILEFWDIDLGAYPRWGTRSMNPTQEARVREVLNGLMLALSPARLHFGWRVVDDVLDFLSKASTNTDVLPFEAALDGVIYAKILPKLRGEDAPRLRDALSGCEKILEKFSLGKSKAKIAELIRDLETVGSARFWR
jgi:5-methylcytosine-specific restriction protein B